jgi:hypothetical protein
MIKRQEAFQQINIKKLLLISKPSIIMSRFQLFQYAVVVHKFEGVDNNKKYIGGELIIPPTTELAKDEKSLAFKVTRLIPEDKISDPDDIEIIIRPF